MNDYHQTFIPSEEDDKLYALVVQYHTECEAYDRTVCTGPIEYNEIMPATPEELRLVNLNATRVANRLQIEAANLGFTRQEFWKAISHYVP